MKTREKCISLYKISCTRANKSKLFCLSFALSLYKISFGSAVSSPVKLRFPALLLLSPCIIVVKDKLRSGNEWLAFRVLMSNMAARDIP